MLTSGDGNCLLHAASLGIWGVHDRWLNLRQDVYHMLSKNTLERRWLWYQWKKNLKEEVVFSSEEWKREWKFVLNMADTRPRSEPQPLSTVPEGNAIENHETFNNVTSKVSNSWQPHYESLEEIHIFSLAHVLHRPVIVVSDKWVYDFQGDPISPIPFAGVYLPVECDPANCCRIPLVLAYFSSHFSPVVPTDSYNQAMESRNVHVNMSENDKTSLNSHTGMSSKNLPLQGPSTDLIICSSCY